MIGNEFSVFRHTKYGSLTYGISGGINHYFSPHIGIMGSIGYRYIYLSNSIGLGEIVMPAIYDKNLLELRFGLVFR